MVSVTIRRRIGVLGVLTGLLGCSSEDPTITQPATTSGSGAAPASGAPPAAGSGSAGQQSSTPIAGAGSGAAGVTSPAAPSAAGSGGRAGATAGTPAAGSGSGSGTAGTPTPAAGSGGMAAASGEPFSFFVASWAAMQRLSRSPDGFGGDLRYGTPDGLSGGDKICTEIAEHSMPGSGAKVWRAFLSVTKGPDGMPVHAIDRVGQGPWYDRVGRLVAMTKGDLMQSRPRGADSMIQNDLPNEDGIPNHAPDGMLVDNHDILTGTNAMGQLFSSDWKYTCHDWTSAVGSDGTPRVGHSWPRMGGGGPPRGGSGRTGAAGSAGGPSRGGASGANGGEFDLANWMSSLNEAGCAAGASLVEMGPPNPNIPTVGSGGGYGGIYCFALKP